MKKKDLNKMVLLGVANGLLLMNATGMDAKENKEGQKNQLVGKRSACGGKKGCGGIIAENDTKASSRADIKPEEASTTKKTTEKVETKTTTKEQSSDKKKDEYKSSEEEDDNGNLGYYLYTEDELLLELNEQGTALYNSLSKEGKELALKVASQRCNGTNECKGLNACKTEQNDCAGKGSCKGQGKCAISDKNLAVKLAADHMAKKRSAAAKH